MGNLHNIVVGLLTALLPVAVLAHPAPAQEAFSIPSNPCTSTLPSPSFQRAISLAPHLTELLYAAGAGDAIIATVSSSDYPKAATELPRIGDGITLHPERLLELHPDAIFAWLPGSTLVSMQPTLERLGIPLLYSRPNSLRDIPQEIRRLGWLFNTRDVACPVAQQLDDRLDALASAALHDGPAVSVYLELGHDPIYTIGNDPLIADVLTTCNAQNSYAHSTVAAPQVLPEELLRRNPHVVIVSQPSVLTQQERLRYWQQHQLPAAVEGRFFGISPDLLYRPGPRLIDATEQLCSYVDQARAAQHAATQHGKSPAKPR
ncbi:ABC transporter substrate-binding protein [Paenalcaligenes suwonensis]|uniref:ABC transporter substrate-binding protein n=1 Tax=Paenalcaligenes suwonensis TaxID=1202713 RepID=UPI00140D747B|nr:ABC transporter substrate-binding protein [Paenalcaligenes suwonensis]NHC60538.1 ABC transporter substrate-binding protein [Paenalcaligenes suwonensis]